MQVKRSSVLQPWKWRAWRPAETVLLCTGNAHFLQKGCSHLRKTSVGKEDWSTRLPQDTRPVGLVRKTWVQNRRSRAGETSLSVKGMLPPMRNTTFRTWAAAGVTLEPTLFEPTSNASRAVKKTRLPCR